MTHLIGFHAVKMAMLNSPKDIIKILFNDKRADGRAQKLLKIAKEKSLSIEFCDSKKLDGIEANNQGVIAFINKATKEYNEADLVNIIKQASDSPLILMLDGVQDPHNLGACLRSADAAGVNAVVIPKDRAVSITAVVEKIASGAAQSVPVIEVTNLTRTIDKLKDLGLWVIGFTEEAEQSLYQIDCKGPVLIVMGAEGAGMRRLTKEHCDYLAHIPMKGVVASLNVSVATGVALFEVVRQRIYS